MGTAARKVNAEVRSMRLLAAAIMGLVVAVVPAHAYAAPSDPLYIVSMANTECLSSNGDGDVYTVPNTVCGNLPHHKWRTDYNASIRRFLIRNVGTNRCLSSNGYGDVYTVPASACGTIAHHYWWLDARVATFIQNHATTRQLKTVGTTYADVRAVFNDGSRDDWLIYFA
jgi:hypothetical protein